MNIREIKRETVDFAQLIRSSECGGLTLDFQSQLVNKLKEEFTDDEQKWFIANFYVYLQYHPTREFPIKLDNIWNTIEFAKLTLENNFVEGEDYKVTVFPREQDVFIRTDKNPDYKNLGGRPEEEILLNVDAFKNLCMITKTGKIQKNSESLFNGLVNRQREVSTKDFE